MMMFRSLSFLSGSLAVIVVVSGQQEGTECTLPCNNGGVCQFGEDPRNYDATRNFLNELGVDAYSSIGSSYMDDSNHEMYCICEDGFAGPHCEWSVCGQKGQVCLNGGSCIGKNYGDTHIDYHCDCSTTYSSNEGDLGVPPFTGRYCEVPVETICDQALTNNGYLFCTNKGTCKGESYLGCNCQDGFYGASCEYDSSISLFDDNYARECSTHCKNGGICRKGAKSMAFVDHMNDENGDLSLYRDPYNGDFEHCVCPPGYMGLHCETEVTVCGDNEAACLNGAPCVETDDRNDKWKCDCASGTYQQLAGDFCQYKKTTHCGTAPNAFCANHGSCKSIGNDEHEFEGCTCKPPFFGFHCEDVWSEAECDLDCGPFGDCRPSPQRDGNNVCLCHVGHTGDLCETRVDTCAGGHEYCFHGGMCMVGELDTEKGMYETWCDCSTAVHGVDGTKYGGPHCELPISEVCDPISVAMVRSPAEEGNDSSLNCYNGGTCKNDGTMGCDCLDSFSGPQCEIGNPPLTDETEGGDGDNEGMPSSEAEEEIVEESEGDRETPRPDDELMTPNDLGEDLRPADVDDDKIENESEVEKASGGASVTKFISLMLMGGLGSMAVALMA